jgi:hypothetical protein
MHLPWDNGRVLTWTSTGITPPVGYRSVYGKTDLKQAHNPSRIDTIVFLTGSGVERPGPLEKHLWSFVYKEYLRISLLPLPISYARKEYIWRTRREAEFKWGDCQDA